MTYADPTQEDLLAEAMSRDPQPLSARERQAEMAVGGLLLAVTLLLLAGPTPPSVDWLPAVGLVLALALASRVRFDVGACHTVPVQVVFVPMVLVLPGAFLLPAVLAAATLARLPEIVLRRQHPGRMLSVLGNAWFAVGPAALMTAGDPTATGSIALLPAVLALQFAGDFAGSAVREWLVSGIGPREQVREALWIYLVDTALAPVGLLAFLAMDARPWAVLLVLPLFGLLAVFARERRGRLEQLVELGQAYRGTALVLGDVVEADDGYTGEHCRGVVALAVKVADEMRLDARERRNVEFGALLHDVGKIAIPKAIINKPGPLTDDEWTVVKTHTIEGQRLLDRVGGFMREIGSVVRAHHERWDGGGYPDGLQGLEIPIAARIVAGCDAYNAMTTTRSYRAAMPVAEALAELRAQSGRQFDPAVVAAIHARLGEVEAPVAATELAVPATADPAPAPA